MRKTEETSNQAFEGWEGLGPLQQAILRVAVENAETTNSGEELVDGLDGLARAKLQANGVPLAIRRLREKGYLIRIAMGIKVNSGGRGRDRHLIVRNPSLKQNSGIRTFEVSGKVHVTKITLQNGETVTLGTLVEVVGEDGKIRHGVIFEIDPYNHEPLRIRWTEGAESREGIKEE